MHGLQHLERGDVDRFFWDHVRMLLTCREETWEEGNSPLRSGALRGDWKLAWQTYSGETAWYAAIEVISKEIIERNAPQKLTVELNYNSQVSCQV